MAWSSKLCLLFIVISVISIPAQCQRFRNNTGSSSSVLTPVLSIIGAIVFCVAFCIGCVFCCYRLSNSNQERGRYYAAPPQTHVIHSSYSTQQQLPTVVYNSTYSQATRNHSNAGSGQEEDLVYYNRYQDNGSRASASQGTR